MFMKTALDHYINILPIEVNASSYVGQSISTKERRFTCPICGEYVYLDIRGRFGHKNKNNESDFCERRTESAGISHTLSYRVGLPVYIRLLAGDLFCLKIGFPPLQKDILKKLSSENIKVQIYDDIKNDKKCITYNLNEERFSFEQTSFLDINFIPESERSYKIELSQYSDLCNKYWSNYADGFVNDKAIFTYHSGEGRKIHKGDMIEANKDYILVSVSDIIKAGVQTKKIGRLKVNSEKIYNVYKIRFDDSNENIFKNLIDFCHDNFKITLVKEKPELIPLWPPTIQNNNSYGIIKNDNNLKVYSAVLPLNAEPVIYRHSDLGMTENKLHKSEFIHHIELSLYNPCAITVSKAYSLDSFGFRNIIYRKSASQINEVIFENIETNGYNLIIKKNQPIEYLLKKGFVLTGIYDNRVIDYKFNENIINETNGLRYIVLSRITDSSNRVIVKKYSVYFDTKCDSKNFVFITNPMIGCMVPITSEIADYLRNNYNDKTKYYISQILMSGEMSLFELKRLQSLIKQHELEE